MRGFHKGMPHGAEAVVALVVGEQEDDVGEGCGGSFGVQYRDWSQHDNEDEKVAYGRSKCDRDG